MKANLVVTQWLESQQTQQGALEALNHEAFFSIDQTSPLAVDPATVRLTEHVATHMDAWPSADYASARERDRIEYVYVQVTHVD